MKSKNKLTASAGRMPALVLPLRVFEVEVKDWSEFTSICAARKPSAAKFMAWNSAKEAGFETVTFGRLRVRRAPEFDGIAEKLPRYPVDRTWALTLKSQQNVQEHATPLAGASVETGVEVHVTGDVADSAASGGCCASPCSISSSS